MAKIAARVTVDRPITDVFEYVVDGDKVPQWRKSCVEIRRLSPDPLGPGTTETYKMKTMGQTFNVMMEVTEYEPSRRYSWKATSGSPFPLQGSFMFDAVEGRTEVSEVTEIRLGGLLRLVEPFIVWMFRREVRTDFLRLKNILEVGI